MKLILRHFANRLMIPRRNKKSVQPQTTSKRSHRVLICFSDVESKIIISSAVTSIFFTTCLSHEQKLEHKVCLYKIQPQGAFSILVFTTPVKTWIFGVIKYAKVFCCGVSTRMMFYFAHLFENLLISLE